MRRDRTAPPLAEGGTVILHCHWLPLAVSPRGNRPAVGCEALERRTGFVLPGFCCCPTRCGARRGRPGAALPPKLIRPPRHPQTHIRCESSAPHGVLRAAGAGQGGNGTADGTVASLAAQCAGVADAGAACSARSDCIVAVCPPLVRKGRQVGLEVGPTPAFHSMLYFHRNA